MNSSQYISRCSRGPPYASTCTVVRARWTCSNGCVGAPSGEISVVVKARVAVLFHAASSWSESCELLSDKGGMGE